MLNPMPEKKRRHVSGEGRDDTCHHGLSRRRPLRVKAPYGLSWKVKVMIKKEKMQH